MGAPVEKGYITITYNNYSFCREVVLTVFDFFMVLCFPRILWFEPRNEKTCLMPYANNNGADQPAPPRSLISAYFFCSLPSYTG